MNNRTVALSQSQASLPTTTNSVMSVLDLKSRLNRMLEVQKTVMKKGVHYDTIPGCKKDSLFQPGAQILNVTFKVGTRPSNMENLSDGRKIHYIVTLEAFDQVSGLVLGYGVGECSSDEEKYAWRESICDEEYDATPDELKRIKYKRGKGGGHYTVKQISTNPADVANTILKMAKKRALINVTLDVLAASEIFTQDIEDLPEGYAQEDLNTEKPSSRPVVNPDDVVVHNPKQAETKIPTEDEVKAKKLINQKQAGLLIGRCKSQGIEPATIAAFLKIPSIYYLTWAKSDRYCFDAILKTVTEKPEFFKTKEVKTVPNEQVAVMDNGNFEKVLISMLTDVGHTPESFEFVLDAELRIAGGIKNIPADSQSLVIDYLVNLAEHGKGA